MRKTREILRLMSMGLSKRKVAASCCISSATVTECLKRAAKAGLGWPLPEDLDDRALEELLYTPQQALPDSPVPDWGEVHRELRSKGVTLQLLHDEYKEQNPQGYCYSWFCQHYRVWRRHIDAVMRQEHVFGDKCFVDYAGPKVSVVNPETGEIRLANIFVAVLGGSNYTYCEATWSQSLPDWLASHVRMFSFFGGVPFAIVPDNLKSGVTKADYYDPDINPAYHDLANHYCTVVLPARKRKPRDKAKAENAVLVVERWILAALRKRTFYSLEELNEAIWELLEQLNNRRFKKLPGSRRSLFESHERPALRPLPAVPYSYGAYRRCRVAPDYHVEVDSHYYSVPYRLIAETVEVFYNATLVQILHDGRRVASHARSYRPHAHTTVADHMPPRHKKMLEWTPERITAWAEKIGPRTAELAGRIMSACRHPQQGFRACLGLLRLRYPADRVEAACARALAIGGISYSSVQSILRRGLDRTPLAPTVNVQPPRQHANLRGGAYFADGEVA